MGNEPGQLRAEKLRASALTVTRAVLLVGLTCRGSHRTSVEIGSNLLPVRSLLANGKKTAILPKRLHRPLRNLTLAVLYENPFITLKPYIGPGEGGREGVILSGVVAVQFKLRRVNR